ncbi:MAG: hypothetical protein O4861_14520 [Trichodesmium sp. St16_bin4-tuft]|nr:hypothetical protein [Trichodesmium sp. ALOHA_ZT_67]MCL2928824.1 hypothetical protein [Trichodesmium sp. MAG_R01]MDE5073792.1 hypothetical protein [Trichodesmium sp. St5_bin8]MDE5090249.1 hypothetical protein [Trichodesmium sp. St18_bin3_1_1]MDE5094700.1 hypothetical protein [Trichodesmium sp. St11_bin5]MDE5099476.1 hypothetical protein [Trichodesmium sp. St16_bin4-tuft]MDE5105073.1 hypothetical protein [Trichodesmium sp. St19_bin2]MDT9339298.1 hypothetical protein [Trichodesmium erythrae
MEEFTLATQKKYVADLISRDLTATKVTRGYLLNREKWSINWATTDLFSL